MTPDEVPQLLGLMGSFVPSETIEQSASEILEVIEDAAELCRGDVVTYRAPNLWTGGSRMAKRNS